MIKFFRDGFWRENLTQMYNVQCWYTPIACEIFQIRAFCKDDAIERAVMLAKQKGYMEKCPYTRFAPGFMI